MYDRSESSENYKSSEKSKSSENSRSRDNAMVMVERETSAEYQLDEERVISVEISTSTLFNIWSILLASIIIIWSILCYIGIHKTNEMRETIVH